MQNNIKKTLVIFSMIFLSCTSFIGINAKAVDIVDKQGTITTVNDNSTSTKVDDSKINDSKTDTAETKGTEASNSINSTVGSKQNDEESKKDDINTVKKKDYNKQIIFKEIAPQWKNINGKLYYVTKDGVLKKTGWFKEEDENPGINNEYEYYLDNNYAATIGWLKIKNSWYYFNEAGIKQSGWRLINYNWYHLNKDGIMETGWIKDDGNKFYLNSEGMRVGGKKNIDDKWYFFGADGILQTGFYNNNGKVYYSDNNGIMVANEWVKTKSNNYYVKADGSIATGNAIIDNEMEEFNSNGKYIGSEKMKEHLFIKYLDVGNADCEFIKLPNGETVLIDTGDVKTSKKVINFLKEQDLKKLNGKSVIDYIIVTHAHSDHIGGLTSILNNFEVTTVYMPDVAIMKDWYSNVKVTTESAVNIEMMKIDYNVYNDALKAMKDKNIKFTNTKKGEYIDKNKILQFVQSDKNFGPIGSPKIVADYWGINENSAIVYLNYGDLQALFTADMEWNSEKDFWVNDLLGGKNVDVLKVPHHGSDTSSTVDYLRYLKADIGIISRASESINKNIAYNNLISNGVSLYETSAKDGISIYATTENWTVQN